MAPPEDDDSIELTAAPWGTRRLCFRLATWQGKKGLDIRLYVYDANTGEWRPTRQGIRIPVSRIEDFTSLLDRALGRLPKSARADSEPPLADADSPRRREASGPHQGVNTSSEDASEQAVSDDLLKSIFGSHK